MPEAYLRVGVDGTAAEQGSRLVRRSLDEIYNSANQANTAVGRLKGIFNDLGYTAGGFADAVMRLVSAFSLLKVAQKILDGIVDGFKAAFRSVDDFKVNVASLSATVMTFMDRTKDANMAESWNRAREYASRLIPTLEIISSKMMMTGQQATLMFTEFAKAGNFLDASNRRAVEGFQAIGNALAILTKGQDPERQVMTEIRAVMTGTAQAGSMLVRMLQSIDPKLKEHLAIWREQGTVIENMGAMLSGFQAATAELANTWQAVSTTTMTYVTQVLRAGMGDAYAAIMSSMMSIRDYIMDHKEQISSGIYKGWLAIKGVIEVIGSLLAPFSPLLRYAAQLVGMIADGLGIIAYVVLPPIAARLGDIIKSALMWLDVIRDLFMAMGEAMTGNFKGAIAYLLQSGREVDASARLVGKAFSDGLEDEIATRYSAFSKKLAGGFSPIAPPKGGVMPGAEDKTISAGLKLEEQYMRNELDLQKRMAELSKTYTDFQYSQGLIDLNTYYESRKVTIINANDTELAAIQKQITEAQDARSKVKDTDNNAEKHRIELTTKEVELEGRANAVRMQTAAQLLQLNNIVTKSSEKLTDQEHSALATLYHDLGMTVEATKEEIAANESSRRSMSDNTKAILSQADALKVLKVAFDEKRRMTELDNQISSLKVADDPTLSGLEAIRQKYDEQKAWEVELRDWKIKNNQDASNEITKINKIEQAETLETQEFKKREWRRGAEAFAESLDQMAQVLSTEGQAGFERGKKLSLASNMIQTYLGATEAFTSLASIPYVGVALGIAAAAAAVAAGLQRADMIESQTYQGRATGGPVEAGGTYVVGENGPEVIRMGGAGSVITNHELAKTQEDQLQATKDLKKAIDNNSLAVGRISEAFTKISGSLEGNVSAGIGGLDSVNLTAEKTGFWHMLWGNIRDIATNAFSIIGNLLTYDFKGLWDNVKTIWSDSKLHLFGGKESITGGGVMLGYNGGVTGSQYTNIHTSGGYFGNESDTLRFSAIPLKTMSTLNDYAERIKSTVLLAAKALDVSTDGIMNATMEMQSLSLIGMTADQASVVLEGWLKSLSNVFASGIEGLSDFQNEGEGAFDALVRLVTALQAVNESAEILGTQMLSASLQNANFASMLIESMGGIEEYQKKISKYFSLFYSDADQQAALFRQNLRLLTLTFQSLGGVVPSTAKGFADIVNALDITTQAGRDAMTALMGIAEAASFVYNYQKQMQEAQTALDYDVQSRLARITGNSGAADLFDLWVKQQKELADAQAKGIDTTELLKVQQLEYAAAAEEASNTVSTANQKLIDSTKKALLDYISTQEKILNTIKGIMTGPMSNLSPEEAYYQAKQRFANASPSDLPDASTALLEASRNYNASGAAYQSDLQEVLDVLASAADIASPTLQAALDQLDILGNIRDAVQNGDMEQLQVLQQLVGRESDLGVLLNNYMSATLNVVSTTTNAAVIASNMIAAALADIAANAAANNAGDTSAADATAQALVMQELVNKYNDTVAAYQAKMLDIEAMATERKNWIAYWGLTDPSKLAYLSGWDISGTGWVGNSYNIYNAMSSGDTSQMSQFGLDDYLQAIRDAYNAAISGGVTGLKQYADGTSYVPSDMPAKIHQGEIIIDRASANILRTYGIRAGNSDEVVQELREQNRQLAALLKVSQYGFSKSIEAGEKQATHMSIIASKSRLEAAK